MNGKTKMINTKNVILAKLFFILVFISVLIFFSSLRPRIMVVHSLPEKNTWIEDFNTGFQRNLLNENHVTISYQYLESKFNLSEINKLKIGVLTRQTIDRLNPDLLVLCGSNAQELIGRTYMNRPGKKIIFCDLNTTFSGQDYDEARNVTNIFRSNPANAIKELISFLPAKKSPREKIKIILLGDNSDLSKIIKQTFSAADWSPYSLIDLMTVNTFEDWKEVVSSIADKADILLVSNYKKIYTDDSQTVLKNSQELINWTTQNTTIPVIGCVDSFVHDGGDIAVTSSPLGQGETAAQVVHRLLHGENTTDILPIHNQDYLVYLNNKPKSPQISKLPSIYHAFAQAMETFEKK